VAATSVLIPVQCEYYALEGLGRLMDTIERVRGAMNPKLELEGVLLCMYDGRMNLTRQVAQEVADSGLKDGTVTVFVTGSTGGLPQWSTSRA
jgi:cellulose biosynthesis protein BcsQ